jgi:hypothetical protein
MLSNSPRSSATPDEPTARPLPPPEPESFGERVLDRVREAFCGLHGHDNLLQFQRDRMFLKCVSCGHESPGWELNETPPTVVARVHTRRAAVAKPRVLDDERRIA